MMLSYHLVHHIVCYEQASLIHNVETDNNVMSTHASLILKANKNIFDKMRGLILGRNPSNER